MLAPLIGVTIYRSTKNEDGHINHMLSDEYVQAVVRAGGMPVLIPAGLPQSDYGVLLARLDGLLLTGGADIDPARFGAQPHPAVHGVDAARDDLEIDLVDYAIRSSVPLLGVCRGIQVMNVALGGTLFTHIPDQLSNALQHDCNPPHPREYLAHTISIAKGSRLAKIIGEDSTQVNSMHHQGIDRLSPDVVAVASSPDHLVEAIEVPNHPFALGVQWHPENLQHISQMRGLFTAFIEAASRL